MGARAPAVAGPGDLALVPYLTGPDGLPQPAPVTHAQLAADLHRLTAVVPISERDVVLAAPPDGCPRDYTVLLDLALLQGATVVASPADGLPDAARRTAAPPPSCPRARRCPPIWTCGWSRPPAERPAGQRRRLLVSRITSSTQTSKTAATVKAADIPWIRAPWFAARTVRGGPGRRPRAGRRCRTR